MDSQPKSSGNHSMFNLSSSDRFKRFERFYLIFFSLGEKEDITVYLYKKTSGGGNTYSTFSDNVLIRDGNSYFSVARYFAENFQGFFATENLDFVNKNEEKSVKLNKYKNVYWFEYWENYSFISWLENISSNIIQYDQFEEEIIFFIELQTINLDLVNKYLARNNIGVELLEVNVEQINECNLDAELRLLVNKLNIKEHIMTTKKMIAEDKLDHYVILSCKPTKDYNQLDQAGFFHFPCLLQGHYRRNNEHWHFMKAAKNEMPSESFLKKVKCLIIPGSHISAYSNYNFIKETRKWLQTFYRSQSNVKFLGLCFGAQILLHSIGGECTPIKTNGFIQETESLKIIEDFWNLPFVKNSKVPKTDILTICELHGDEISSYPNDQFKIYASSNSCDSEILISHDNRCLCIQGHAEYHKEFCSERMIPTNYSLSGNTRDELLSEYNKILASFLDGLAKENWLEFRSICYSFLKNL